jgi:hypothetical protein
MMQESMMHAFLLFLHILGGIGLFIGGVCELVGLQLLLRAKTVEFLRAATTLTRVALVVDPLSSLLVVATGLYFVVAAWGWSVGWIDVALISFALITLAAPALQGRRMLVIQREVGSTADGPVPEKLRQLIQDPVLRVSIHSVLPLATGLLALMILKPSLVGAVLIMGSALLLGVLSALPRWQGPRHTDHLQRTSVRTENTLG